MLTVLNRHQTFYIKSCSLIPPVGFILIKILRILFTVNLEFEKISSLYKNYFKDEIPSKLFWWLEIIILKKNLQYNFLKVMIGEQIFCIDHVRTVVNKIAINIDLLYRASQFLNEDPLKTVYFYYVHPYLNYGNIPWASTYATKLNRVISSKNMQYALYLTKTT